MIGVFAPLDQWICGVHWRMVSTRTKALHRESKRRLRADRTLVAYNVQARIWRRCKSEAIEGAAGI